MIMWEKQRTIERLGELERTIDTLTGRLRDVQWELQQTKAHSLRERLWKNLMNSRQGSEFMSSVCNRHIRPNTKMVHHVGSIAGY
jgi:hypothetical protein